MFSNGLVCLIDDFKKMDILSEKGKKTIKLKGQDKGHSAQFKLIAEALRNGEPMPIPFNEIYHSSLLTLQSLRSINEARVIEII